MKVYTYIFCVILIGTLICQSKCQEWYEVGNPHFLDVNNVFEAIKQQKAIKILKFFSPWCKYCRYIKTYMDNYKNSQKMSPKLKFYQFNCQSNGPMFCVQNFQVGAYPAVIIFNEKGERISRIDGLYPQQVIHTILKQMNEKAILFEQTIENTKVPQQQKPKNQLDNTVPEKQSKTQQKLIQKQKQQKQQKKQQQKTQQQKIVDVKIQEKKQKQKQQVKQEQKKQQQNKQQKIQDHKVQILNEKPVVKQQQVKVQQKENIKIEARLTEKKAENKFEQQKQAQANKENNKQEIKLIKPVEGQKDESIHWFQYLIYCLGGAIGSIYAYRIFTSKKQSDRSSHQTNRESTKLQEPQATKLNNKDIEHDIMVEEVVDQNL